MRRGLCALVIWLCASLEARADDEQAKQRFEAGFQAAAERRWDEAAAQFEASLRESDKPAVRFNLILVYHELERPLELARHALAFLAGADSDERKSARVRAGELLAEAKRALAALDTATLPQGTQLWIDGAAPGVRDGALLYVLPGVHVLEAEVDQRRERVTLSLRAGEVSAWPLTPRPQPQPASMAAAPTTTPALASDPSTPLRDVPSDNALRKWTVWSAGVAGAALFVSAGACLGKSYARGNALAADGIEGSEAPGYLDEVDHYRNAFHAIVPLALSGGVLMAGAILIGNRATRVGSLTWSIASMLAGAAALGVGTYLVIREPSALIPTSEVVRPSRQAGGLLLAASLPLASYGVGYLVSSRRDVRLGLSGLSSLRVSW